MQRQYQLGHLRSSLQNSEFKTARYFFVLCQNQIARITQHSGSEYNLNSPYISWRCMAAGSQSIARVVASGWVPKIHTRVARAANKKIQGTAPAAQPLIWALGSKVWQNPIFN